MDMIAPFAKTGLITEAQNLWLAIPTGFLLGLSLQLAGFTDGRKIGRAFYFNDVDVPIVMFSAIITGMLGLWGLSLIGYLDISKVYFVPTYLYPVMLGGFLFGIGMVVGGYCPGTALASVVSGKLDALVYLLGFFIGRLLQERLSGLLATGRGIRHFRGCDHPDHGGDRGGREPVHAIRAT